MAYYPTNYGSYNPYTGIQPNPNVPQYQPPIMQQNYQMPSQQPQPQMVQGLNGKIVDSEDMVKATEVPIGGYGIFPKGDLSEIYVKSWNNNGTTSIMTFKPVIIPDPSNQVSNNQEVNNLLLQKIEKLENKIDAVLDKQPNQPKQIFKNVDKEDEVK